MVITFYLRKEGQKEWLKIDLKIRGKNKQKLRIQRAVEIPKTKLEEFKQFLKDKLKPLEHKLTQEELKELFAKLYQEFTGKPLPQRRKAQPKELKIEADGSNPQNIKTLASLYLDYVKATKQPKTFQTRFEELSKLIEFFGNIKATKLTQKHILQYQLWRKNQNVSNRTVNKEIACLRALLNWAIDNELIKKHNIKKFPMLPETKKLHNFLTEEEFKTLLNALSHNPLLKLRVLFSVLTGLRPKEVAYLEWQDIDLKNKILYVRSKPENKVKDHEERAIPLCEQAIQVLKEANKLSKGRFVFSKNGKPTISIRKQLERACRKVGLKKVFPYMLRHTFAVLCLKSGMGVSTQVCKF